MQQYINIFKTLILKGYFVLLTNTKEDINKYIKYKNTNFK